MRASSQTEHALSQETAERCPETVETATAITEVGHRRAERIICLEVEPLAKTPPHLHDSRIVA